MIPTNKSFPFNLERLKEYTESYKFNHDEIIEEFEETVCQYTGAKYCIATNSATAGIFLILFVLQEFDRFDVLVSSYGYPAVYRICDALGLNPVTIDMDTNTLGMDIDCLKSKISFQTLAVVNVETNGMMGNMREIRDVCRENDLWFIEDSASSIVQKYDGFTSGTYGDVGVYSFTPTKVMNSGEGGAIVTNDEMLATKIRALRYNPDVSVFSISFNFSMSPFLAAILIPQFQNFNYLKSVRERVYNLYKKHGLNVYENPDVNNAYPYAIYKTPSANKLKEKLDKLRIGNVYKRYAYDVKCPGAVEMDSEIIFLPSLYDMTEDQIKSICTIAKGF